MLSDPANQVKTTNRAIDDALLGVGNAGDPTREALIDFARGVDVTDTNQNGNLAETRQSMGDPLHSKPVSVIYGPTLDQALIFFATNDGYLHAIDPGTGIEQWAFVPPEFLGDLAALYDNESSASKHYGIDGDMKIQTSADSDGIIDADAGERVYLYFGLRRGGTFYYALDVTNPNQPQFMWRLDAGDLPGVGQTWSNPVPTRIKIADASQNADQLVLLFGGGYDTSQDNYGASTDATGNAIYMVDSISGQLLWHASQADADRNLAQMTYSIPGDLKVVDLNGDKRADRVYAADMGGQVWRFDILNGQPSSTLVNGGVIAQLGAAGQKDAQTTQATRRFYYAPDVALVSNAENSFLHIGIGSGHRARPLSTATRDRFYALRDYDVFGTRTQAEYDALQPITDDALVNVTTDVDAAVPMGAPGWKLELREGGGLGEKVLAQARTFDNQVFFTTFTPAGMTSGAGCVPSPGTNRLYAVNLLSGAPVTNLDGPDDGSPLDAADRSVEIKGSISSEVVFMFPSADDPEGCMGDECAPNPVACVDLFCFDLGFDNRPVRTVWSQDATQ
jgi:type IV pilus assembly protein PilY1